MAEIHRKDRKPLRLKLDEDTHELLRRAALYRDATMTKLCRRYLREGAEHDIELLVAAGLAPQESARPKNGARKEGRAPTRRASLLAAAAIGALTLLPAGRATAVEKVYQPSSSTGAYSVDKKRQLEAAARRRRRLRLVA